MAELSMEPSETAKLFFSRTMEERLYDPSMASPVQREVHVLERIAMRLELHADVFIAPQDKSLIGPPWNMENDGELELLLLELNDILSYVRSAGIIPDGESEEYIAHQAKELAAHGERLISLLESLSPAVLTAELLMDFKLHMAMREGPLKTAFQRARDLCDRFWEEEPALELAEEYIQSLHELRRIFSERGIPYFAGGYPHDYAAIEARLIALAIGGL